MKADDSRSPVTVKHQLDHELPTVIHHPEEEMPLLARWLDRAMQNQTRFWGLIAAVVLVTVGLSVLGSGLSLGRAANSEAWLKLENAKKPGERVEIAKEYPKTPAERWARLEAATEYYNQGFNDLPANREAAMPSLKLALDQFQAVADEAEPDSIQARVAALGVARAYEARGELAKAVKQYERVASNKAWAGTEEAATAARLAAALQTDEVKAFYKDLAAYKAVETTLPAGGTGALDLPLPPGHPPLGAGGAGAPPFVLPLPGMSGSATEPSPLSVPPPPPSPEPRTEAPAPAPSGTTPALPDDVFTPGGASK